MKLYNSLQPLSQYLLWIFITFTYFHNGHYFPILSMSQGWAILKTIYFLPVILVIIPIIVLTVWKGQKSKEKT